MRRRTFLAGAGSALLSRSARADKRLPRIGYLQPDAPDASGPFYEAFQAGLRDLGYVPGESVEIVSRFAYGDESQLAVLAGELVERKVDLIVTGGPGIMAAHRATSTRPIVVAVGGDLVGAGLAESLNHPGGNVTGSSYIPERLMGKRISLLKQAKPALKSVGFLVTKGFSGIPRYLDALKEPAAALGVAIQVIEVSSASDCDAALAAGARLSIDGLAVLDLPQFTTGAGPGLVAAAATKRGLPSVGGLYLGRNGALLGYGVDFAEMFRRAATFVDKILKGEKPGDIPIEQATKFLTTVNLRTAMALSLEIPPTLLAAADEVIE